MWIDVDHMGVAVDHTFGHTEWRVVMAAARQRMVRSFTDDECRTYDIDPYPTLEEMRAGG